MASYFSSLLTTTTSRVASIRQNLLPSENDGDTEDDTHICRVLRAYYTEKGRSFPAWLPPDPKAPPPVVVQPVYATSIGARYGGLQTQGPAGGAALSSLWDSQPAQQAPVPESLRPARGANRLAPGSAAAGGAQRPNPFTRGQSSLEPAVQARPLPSQRAGSYQTGTFGQGAPTPPGSAGSGSAQDRLRNKLRGGAKSNPAPAPSQPTSRMNNSHSSTNGSHGGYEQAMPSSGSGGSYGGGSSYGGSGSSSSHRGGDDKPFMAATAPWASNEMEFGGGGYGYDSGAGAGTGRQGLPSGPGAARRGPGLPSGPRAPRY
jgi:hypothetical protein